MSTAALLIVSTAAGVAAAWFVMSGLGRITPSLATVLDGLRRPPPTPRDGAPTGLIDRLGALTEQHLHRELSASTTASLRVLERPVEAHLGALVVAAMFGLATPALVVAIAATFGAFGGSMRWLATVGAAAVLTIALPLAVHTASMDRAADVRMGLRHQLSAFVDMVTMLLAGNAGHEHALRLAADAGDGQLFRALRRRMREVSATGRSLVDALDLVADDYQLPELTQIAATARLAAAEGAPVSRSLAAKCATLRSTLATDQEAEARVRTDKVTPPLVGMTLLFMAVLVYPALDL